MTSLQAQIQQLRSIRSAKAASMAAAAAATPPPNTTAAAPATNATSPAVTASAAAPAKRQPTATDEDNLVSAAGLMQLSSAAAVHSEHACARDKAVNTGAQAEKTQLEPVDTSLPAGWRRVLHDSGLPCFMNESLRLVCWSKPYALDSMCSAHEFDRLVRTHVPPLSIFHVSSNREQGKPQAENVRPNDSTASPQQAPSSSNAALVAKSKNPDPAVETDTVKAPTITVVEGGRVPVVRVNGVCLENPDGMTANGFLRELTMLAFKCAPQYVFTKNEDLQNPVTCSVRINDNEYVPVTKASKAMAKVAAAESTLEQLIPGYWEGLKKSGVVGVEKKQGDKAAGANDEEPTITQEEFKAMEIGDPRVLQACMKLSIKTPAQVLQEYQNRNRGVSINYNTVPVEIDGIKMFKTIVTAGSTAAEGVASTKKVAKQLGAQALLALLHERTHEYYYEVAESYSSISKSHPAAIESSQTSQTQSPALPTPMQRATSADARVVRMGPGPAQKKVRRTSPVKRSMSGGYPAWQYNDQSRETYGNQSGGSGDWHNYAQYPQQPAAWSGMEGGGGGPYGPGRDRIVEYSTQPSPAYSQYYANTSSSWGYNTGPPPNVQPQYGYSAPHPSGYGMRHVTRPNPSDRSGASDRGKANGYGNR